MSYASLDELKDHVGIADAAADGLLQIALDAAVEAIDTFTKRHFRTVDTDDDAAKTTRVFTAKSARLAIIADAAEVDSVEDRTSPTASYETVDAADYEVEPVDAAADDRPFTRIKRITGWWPDGSNGVRVTAWFGWPATPAKIKEATLLQASRFYRRRESALGISQVPSLEGGTGMRVLPKLDADVELMIRSYRRLAW